MNSPFVCPLPQLDSNLRPVRVTARSPPFERATSGVSNIPGWPTHGKEVSGLFCCIALMLALSPEGPTIPAHLANVFLRGRPVHTLLQGVEGLRGRLLRTRCLAQGNG